MVRGLSAVDVVALRGVSEHRDVEEATAWSRITHGGLTELEGNLQPMLWIRFWVRELWWSFVVTSGEYSTHC